MTDKYGIELIIHFPIEPVIAYLFWFWLLLAPFWGGSRSWWKRSAGRERNRPWLCPDDQYGVYDVLWILTDGNAADVDLAADVGSIGRDDCDWYQSYLHISKDQNIAKFFKEIDTHNSLSLYKALKNHNLCENYLKNDFDFYGSQLKFLARANVFGLDTNYEKWKKSDGICKHCKNNVKDTLEHRILMCPHFLGERLSFYNNVEIKISSILSSYLISSSNQK